jgi:hypothetical protein
MQAQHRKTNAEHHDLIRSTQLAAVQNQVLLTEQQQILQIMQIQQTQLVNKSVDQALSMQNNSDVLCSLQQVLMRHVTSKESQV